MFSTLSSCYKASVRLARIALVLVALATSGCGPGIAIPGIGVIGGTWRYHCGPIKTAGQYCETQDECIAGTYCDTDKKVCSTAFVATGGPCKLGFTGCTGQGPCVPGPSIGTCYSVTCSGGACTTGASMNVACDPNNPTNACGSNGTCVITTPNTGTCGVRPKLGEFCEDFAACADGLICDIYAQKCGTGVPVGGACQIKEICAKGLQCLAPGNTVADPSHPGTCQPNPHLAVGVPCIGAVCAVGAHCDYSVNKCAKDYAIGKGCSQGNECGEAPGIAADCVQGTCTATAKAGDKCYPGPEQRCAGGLFCTSEP